ncbi:hypothetical protein T492DRAFT_1065900 [Pavlovales sp. CCMP2436]|nr:hypothetical protein T492DRAFT_1065900 [Pavlovales sp. CCMP2436]
MEPARHVPDEEGADVAANLLGYADAVVEEHKRCVRWHLGPFLIEGTRVRVQPKFNLGIQGGALYAMAGIRDVRDGLAIESLIMLQAACSSEGASLGELLTNAREAHRCLVLPCLGILVANAQELVAAVLVATGIDVDSRSRNVRGTVMVYVAAGFSAGIALGWQDTAGYRTYGVEGKIASLISLGFTIRIGTHKSGRAVRLCCYFANFAFDVTFRIDVDETLGVAAVMTDPFPLPIHPVPPYGMLTPTATAAGPPPAPPTRRAPPTSQRPSPHWQLKSKNCSVYC